MNREPPLTKSSTFDSNSTSYRSNRVSVNCIRMIFKLTNYVLPKYPLKLFQPIPFLSLSMYFLCLAYIVYFCISILFSLNETILNVIFQGELTPILVQMVKSANTNGLLDNDCDSSKYQTLTRSVQSQQH